METLGLWQSRVDRPQFSLSNIKIRSPHTSGLRFLVFKAGKGAAPTNAELVTYSVYCIIVIPEHGHLVQHTDRTRPVVPGLQPDMHPD